MSVAEPASGAPAISPIEATERIELLDILRGFAIFGILVVNLLFFSAPIQWTITPPWTAAIDRITNWGIAFFFTGKFYSLFSMLFGIGLAVQMSRAEARSIPIARLYRRRLLVLLLIGLSHAIFIWYGDILHLYALLGFLLLWFRVRQTKTIIRAIFVSVFLPAVLILMISVFIELLKFDPATSAQIDAAFAREAREGAIAAAEAVRVYSTGSYTAILRQRLLDLARIDSYALLFTPHIFAMFLLGLYAGRERLFINTGEKVEFFKRVQFWGLIVGIIGNVGNVLLHEIADPARPSLLAASLTFLYVAGAPALMLFYVSTITLALQDSTWRARLRPLGSVGRLALSNYLAQSLICTTIFYSHGLGLFARVPPSICLVIAVVIYSIQIVVSVWWLKRFRFGPAEWLWRSLTYGKAQPMRVEAVSAA